MKNKLVSPMLKWVGGKRQLLETYRPYLPKNITSYCEPFLGGGAMLFELQPKVAYINDINEELMRVYRVIQEDVEALIEQLSVYPNTPEFFYEIRNRDRNPSEFEALSDIQKAARVIYLNKTCYNGLYRVNNAGEFNSPFGHYKNPNIVNAPVLRAVSAYFRSAQIHMSSSDYKQVLQGISKGTFVYLDPPYDPVSDTANFTGYTKGGFSKWDQIELRQCCDELNERGIRFMLSNSATDFICEQYSKYHIIPVKAKRAVNCAPTKRGDVDEVLVINYE